MAYEDVRAVAEDFFTEKYKASPPGMKNQMILEKTSEFTTAFFVRFPEKHARK